MSERTCEMCGALLDRWARADARYCSGACRVRRHRGALTRAEAKQAAEELALRFKAMPTDDAAELLRRSLDDRQLMEWLTRAQRRSAAGYQ